MARGSKACARARAFALTLAWPLLMLGCVSCGSGDGKHLAVECRLDEDCEDAELGVCDLATCVEGRCELDTRPDGHRCDDSDSLTGEDACLSGICAGVAKTCEDDLGPCLKAVNDPETNECVVEPVDDGAPCDDEDACTQRDSCEAGACVGAEPKTCEALDDCHVAGECDAETGECSEPKAEDGSVCDDGLLCTSDDVCQDGACGGSELECDDGLTCSRDACDEASGSCGADVTNCSCEQDEDCNDGNLCNGAEHCDLASNLCQPGTATVCPDSSDPCLRNVCLAETGACEPMPAVNGTLCDDADACTGQDSCQAGVCLGSDAVVCTALSQCHTPGTCDPLTGACDNPEQPANASCNDADACTATDTCQAGECVGSGQVSCQPSDQCHDAGVCNAQTGGCSNPAKPDGVGCDDDDLCTGGDACNAGVCTPSSQTSCSPLDGCHLMGSCDPATGNCSNPVKPDGSVCNDNSLCSATDTCTAGKCGGPIMACNDGVACTVDSCSDQLGGCENDRANCPCTTSADCNDGNACNGTETCNLQTLQCAPGTTVNCAAFDDACNVGVCNPTSGACGATPKQNGTTCDDADACTPSSSCQAGVCQGANRKTCTASDQCHDAGTCNPSTGVCSNPVKSNSSPCNDGDACTRTDTCQAGKCTGASAVVCAASDDCHNIGSCNKSTGVCTNPAKTNGSLCSDGNLCTTSDGCQGGVCVGASPKTCPASDQCHQPGVCDPASGSCSNPAKANGSACVDDSVCTLTDTCQNGTCTGANLQVCRAKDQCHDAGTCDKTLGCSDPAKTNGAPCVDPSKCTTNDSCQGGVCGGDPVVCQPSDQCHDAGSCDPASGSCSNPAKPDTALCNDNKNCTDGDKCTAGVCRGTSITCSDAYACTVDTCVEPTGCKFDPGACECDSDAKCDDGNPCNGTETCNKTTLTCVQGTTKDCSGLDDACNVGSCDRQTGACKATPRTDGTACSDSSACTRSDSCQAGKCVGASPITCTASDACHDVGTCNPATGTCTNPVKSDGSPCDDLNKCSKTDSCQAGKCTGSNPVVCAASDDCHDVGTCAPATGLCTSPVKADGSSCNDNNQCSKTDRCQTGKCVGGNPVVCSSSDDCHDIGVCAPATGICSNPVKTDGSACDDKSKCTATDACQTGKCVGGTPTVCTALGKCYLAGTCDAGTGICSNPPAGAGTSCDDSNACTTGETCDGSGACSRGNAVVCPTPPQCKVSVCDPIKGCGTANALKGTLCDDGKACTQPDSCAGGVCSGAPRNNFSSDWADDPGVASSVDTFTDKEGNAVIVGVHRGTIEFNDKDTATFTPLALPTGDTIGVYWAVYRELGGAIVRVAGIASGLGELTVSHAAGHADGSFTVLGTVQGDVAFGRTGTNPFRVSAKQREGFVAHYRADGSIDWFAKMFLGQSEFTADAVAAFDDGAVIAIGTVAGLVSFRNAKDEQFATAEGTGVWAARFTALGVGQWGAMVVRPGSTATAHAVTTHEDGGASLTGTFVGSALLGRGGNFGELPVGGIVKPPRIDDEIWYQKLDEKGSIQWGGRLGGSGADIPGDIARGKAGGALLLANVLGSGPNATEPKNGVTQPLFATSPGVLQAHVIGIDGAGLLVSDGLIADSNLKGGTHGYQLKLDAAGTLAVGGTFSDRTDLWSGLGFGSGAPPATGINLSIDSTLNGSSTLFAARVDQASRFSWAVAAGGNNSGMASGDWDIVMTGHASQAVTLAGMFKARLASFGDEQDLAEEKLATGLPLVAESLSADVELGSPFVVHLNSEAEHDYCQ